MHNIIFCILLHSIYRELTIIGEFIVMKLHEAVGKRILEFCNERNISPNKLCTMSGIIQSTVNSIFSGRSQNPKLATIQYLCEGLNISLKDFFDSPLFDNLDD